MPEDEVVGTLGELQNVLGVRVELEAQLLSSDLVIVFHIEIFVEH